MARIASARAAGRAGRGRPNISGLAACVEDSRLAGLDSDAGPREPNDYHQLLGRLETSRSKLPPLYLESVFKPYSRKLRSLGQSGFARILARDKKRQHDAGLMLDIAQAILQNGEGYAERSTDAFEEVVSDLYDGFLSAEDRRGVAPPERGIIAPLVKWGDPASGPYTWPGDATADFGAKCAIVSLPPANAKAGLLAWSTLGHETAGHDILGADIGLKGEIVHQVQTALDKAKVPPLLPDYWSSRIDETASDVLGILNMGPAAGIGLIGYFRGLNAAFEDTATLRNDGPADDDHPADILRGFLAASAVRRLKFAGAEAWAKVIEAQSMADHTSIVLEDKTIKLADAKRSADIVAATIMGAKLDSLEHHALGEIQNWRDADEQIVQQLRPALAAGTAMGDLNGHGVYAAHAVAAAVYAAVAGEAAPAPILVRMTGVLKTMHDENPSWGPLFVRHPGSMVAHRAYVRHQARRGREERR